MKYSRRDLGLLIPTLIAATATLPKALEAQQAAPAGGNQRGNEQAEIPA